jgi:hypothetical protein
MYRGVKSNWWEIFKNFLLMKIYLSSDAEGNKARVFFSRFLGFELGAEVLKYSNVMGTAGWDTSFTLPNGFHQFLSEHPHFYVTRNPVV